MLTIKDALLTLLPAFNPVGQERVTLQDSLGLYCAETIPARTALPPFHNSAMDGYAVRTSEVPKVGTQLPLVGESRAGGALPEHLAEGTAMRIFTGAPLPEGADAVVMQENTEATTGGVTIRQIPKIGEHVRHAGEDVALGTTLLEPGAALGPGEIALLASQRVSTLCVYRPPTVAILSTGDELAEISDPIVPGRIINSNSYALEAQTRLAGGIPWVLPTAPDDLDSIVASLTAALRADLVITSGGVSVGTYDFVHTAFERVGVEASFWKVAVKPGKPVAFGLAGTTPVVGLPGNPVSSMVTFELFVRPGIRRMLGDPAPHPRPFRVFLERNYRHKPGRLELARARLSHQAQGWVAELNLRQDSGSLTSVVGVDALVLLPGDQEHFEAGEPLMALPFPAGRGATHTPF